MVEVEIITEETLPSSPEWTLLWSILPWLLTPLALAIHLYQAKVASFLADGVRMLYANKENDEKVRKLAADLSALRAEQRLLSPVNDFALYFKKDRAAIKLQEQYDQAVKDRSSATPHSLMLTPLTMAVAHLVPVLLINLTPQPTAVCLPYSAFWPFNGLLRFPSVFSSSVESRCDELSTDVSLCVFLYLAVLFFKRALRK
ncbi:hypothetical protein PMAYCL1PPCAC_24545 [Pristionchus mayeri]|uniref:Tail-anchored protein insertion receptor WRB n=1 Tax=Pristionchus mayeri TaxID=1317129 RepID=A0AAN5D1H5_9BILA|nr:hypothetical protein PMAYCL1PPCAC_24545 [Pristionchus mayeri]